MCLGQEGRRVDALRTMLAETGADIDAIIAQFEAEEEAQIEELVANQMGDAAVDFYKAADPDETTVDDGESERWVTSMENALPEISASMQAAAAEIATPERTRDVSRTASTLNADADEFILPTPPKGARHERNLQNAFELA